MSKDRPSDPPAQDVSPDDAAISAADFLLATRQHEEAQQRAAQARRSAHDDDDEHGKQLLAEMIELQQHSGKDPKSGN